MSMRKYTHKPRIRTLSWPRPQPYVFRQTYGILAKTASRLVVSRIRPHICSSGRHMHNAPQKGRIVISY
jgi:hypothetical protein